jgi:hypothetical protein
VLFVKYYFKKDFSWFIFYYVLYSIMKKSSKQDARRYCANWDAGKCLGAMMYRKDGVLRFVLDKDKADKDCAIEKGCDYFDNIVIPGINENGI